MSGDAGAEARDERLAALTSWRADWTGLAVAVLGLGVTGFSVADTLTELGCDVLVVAARADDQRAGLVPVIGARLTVASDQSAVPEELVEHAPDVVVVSPGFRPDHAWVAWADREGIPVWGDIELAWRVRDKVSPAQWIAVTGTNGKTTTVQLAATMLVTGGMRAAPCGNIGVPVLDAVRDPAGFDVLVVELSSFQLHWLARNDGAGVTPLASACLNLVADHLDWHGSAEAYRDAKATVYRNTAVACVYNRDDPVTEEMVREAEVTEGARAIGFGLGIPGPSDFGVVEGILCDRAYLEERFTTAIEITTVEQLAVRGLAAPHVVSDILAAAALSRAAGIGPAAVRDALAVFELDAHRIQLLAVAGDVAWVDDSKATNPHAAQAALRAYPSVVWIAGGLTKGVDVADLVRDNAGRIRTAVLIGDDRSALRDAFARHAPDVPVHEVPGGDTGGIMPAAVRLAGEAAKPGDTVLLAPAAASMDQFTDYAERGRLFAEAVREFLGGPPDDDPDARRAGA